MPSRLVMKKWKEGKLHSGSKHGPRVESQKQAVAIMLSEKRNEQQHGGAYKDNPTYNRWPANLKRKKK